MLGTRLFFRASAICDRCCCGGAVDGCANNPTMFCNFFRWHAFKPHNFTIFPGILSSNFLLFSFFVFFWLLFCLEFRTSFPSPPSFVMGFYFHYYRTETHFMKPRNIRPRKYRGAILTSLLVMTNFRRYSVLIING